MTATEKMLKRVRILTEPVQGEGLHFVEFLMNKSDAEERKEWESFSLSESMRGMESESCEYREMDIKEFFK